MDTVTEYGYAFGPREDLRAGLYLKMRTASSLDGLDLSQTGTGIIELPYFVGVYQISALVPESREEKANPGWMMVRASFGESSFWRAAGGYFNREEKQTDGILN
jgi:hypothetical protein